MNTGIQDAIALGHALTTRTPEALADYERTRRPVAEQVVRLTDRMTRLATARGPARLLRNAAVGTVLALPPARRRLTRTLAELDYR
jgi:2-polyprenyl-6-methoxyphenol hydroxylase-like FAD-dependent oxidoreductase